MPATFILVVVLLPLLVQSYLASSVQSNKGRGYQQGHNSERAQHNLGRGSARIVPEDLTVASVAQRGILMDMLGEKRSVLCW